MLALSGVKRRSKSSNVKCGLQRGERSQRDPALGFQWPDFPFGSIRSVDEDIEEPVNENSLAVEYIRDGRREFILEDQRLDVVEKHRKKNFGDRIADRFTRYFLPAGYPTSVGPDYWEYTIWRLSAFFWGGCVGVFSTQGLLLAVGVGRQSSAPLAAALQWVIRDGVGRAGRMIFSQIGTGFDAETKQHRLVAAAVLNLSCTLESVSPVFPGLFLPIASLANLAKGASTIAAASTRGAIYRSFMRRENLGDITAKQETVGVAGDLAGTALGIALSRLTSSSLLYSSLAFTGVSILHLFSAYREVRSLQLNTLNRQRSHMLIKEYLLSNEAPSVYQVNRKERVLFKPWLDSLHAPNIDLAARLRDCAPDAEALTYLLNLYRREKYILTYENERVRIVLRKDAKGQDCLKAFLQAGEFWMVYKERGERGGRNREFLEESYMLANSKFKAFVADATTKGWNTDSVLLRPVGRRVIWGDALR
eukprot:Plantae.Rhodophyta-Purpureofilum_apyrenoidigerum.ctg6058.p1 GENE.Plantae.Rhodophyta-Purpureofilum_apyrenoidigerum.ctg6058~~Plantae.Rhodophyta-Purpureofilum_apyrenoidigerum.ctg6058.p1  ORF type:complete len:478 (+),score=56.99 Plantae.Rhodophyta-Purpureofilum_apyrenoidigerum.ctg6058:92-1525(+)